MRELSEAEAKELRLAIGGRLIWLSGPCEQTTTLEVLRGLLDEGLYRVAPRG